MSRFAGGGQSWVLGKLGLSAESAGVQAPPSLAPPWHLIVPAQEPAPAPGQSASLLHGPPLFEPALQVGLQTGQLWIPGAFGKRSPVRKSSELSGRLRLEAPLEQSVATPRAENAEFVMALGIARSVPEAIQTATSQLATWLEREHGLSSNEAAVVLGFAIRYDIAELVDPQVHVVAKLPKGVLAQIGKPQSAK